MRRLVPSVSVLVLSAMILFAFWATAGRPLNARAAGEAWEYGSLELVQTGRGTAYVFCQYNSEGRTETPLEVRPLTTPQWPPMSTDRASSNTDAAAARALARLGREGWELVTETTFARYADDQRVLMFKRPAR